MVHSRKKYWKKLKGSEQIQLVPDYKVLNVDIFLNEKTNELKFKLKDWKE